MPSPTLEYLRPTVQVSLRGCLKTGDVALKRFLPLNEAAAVGDGPAACTQYAAASALARERVKHVMDLAYGDDPVERLDFFSAGTDTPLVVVIHGGYWRLLYKEDYSFVAQGLVPLGVSVASINYGLTPETSVRTIVEQCRRAVSWIASQANYLRFDSNRISIVGHSAGGHLAAMAAVTTPVQSLVTIGGVHDLVPVQQSFANEWMRLDEREARDLSPVSHAPLRPLPVLAVVGDCESEAYKMQAKALIDAWAPYGCRCEYLEVQGDNHYSIILRLRDPLDALSQRIAAVAAG